MFFLKDKYVIGYKWGSLTFYGTKHLGTDYLVPVRTAIFAPSPGTIKTSWGPQGGNTLLFRPDGQNVTYRFLHLEKFVVQSGYVNEGDLIALSGNTGLSSSPHIHFDAFKGSVLPPLIYTNFINPDTINWKIKYMVLHRILVLLNGVSDNQLLVLKQGIENVKSRIALLGDIRVEVDFLVIDRVFNTVSGQTTSGTGTWVKPEEIGEEGRKGEILLSKEFDLVCLVYDKTKVIGDPPTNPVENPVTIEGFNINQIPTVWFNDSYDGARLFFYHEMLHSWYYIINSELSAGLTDQVHNFTWPPNQPGPTLEDNMVYFDSLSLQLKPYWPALANSAANPAERTGMLAFKYKGTVYLAVFAKFVPVADQDTFLELGGNWNSVKELTDAEFNSIVKPFLAASTILK